MALSAIEAESFLALWLILLAALNVACADDTVFKVGVTTRDFIPVEPYD